MKKTPNARIGAVQVLARISNQGQSLTTALPAVLETLPDRERGLCQEICYGTLRWYPQLEFWLNQLLRKPLKPTEHEVKATLLSAIYQLEHMRTPEYAVVSEAVTTIRKLNKTWAAAMANAVLRGFVRRREELRELAKKSPESRYAHPKWIIERARKDWPDDWESILEASTQRPPLTLRVNAQKTSRDEYLKTLAGADIEADPAEHTSAGLMLKQSQDVTTLPGFTDGLVSVQDAAAQLAAGLLAPEAGHRVLDACAAPGGKTSHLVEFQPDATVIAVDIEERRVARIAENLDRLGLTAELVTADILQPDRWWDGVPFDRILLDAPCSASGVIRRHPDIKLLRRNRDIADLAALQVRMLDHLWPLLAPEGILVYATCSIFQAENEETMAKFTEVEKTAEVMTIDAEWGRVTVHGRQILPGESGMDGFFYARLRKKAI